MWDILPRPIRNFIDSIFGPPITFLELMRDMLANAGTVAGKGINLNNYFSFFGYMPVEWQNVVKSALTSIVLLAIMLLVRAIWDVYLKVKNSAQWW
jgi:hypothetical protein